MMRITRVQVWHLYSVDDTEEDADCVEDEEEDLGGQFGSGSTYAQHDSYHNFVSNQ